MATNTPEQKQPPFAKKYCAASIASLRAELRSQWLNALTPRQLAFLLDDWEFWARQEQRPPASPWHTWLILGGRGAGKTRAGAEWIRSRVESGARHIALIGETFADAREVMVAGVSGIIAAHGNGNAPCYETSRRRLVWDNGAVAYIFSAEDPEALRGPQFDTAWCDEIGKWRRDEETWNTLAFALRIGADPKICATTTPRNTPLLRRLLDQHNTALTRMSSMQNQAHLAPGFIEHLLAQYGGSRLARQEMEGELLEDDPDALWKRHWIDAARTSYVPPLTRTVVGLDPCVSTSQNADSCGIVVAGISADQRIYVLADRTITGAHPNKWASAVQQAVSDFNADTVVAEVNQGGDLISVLLNAAGVKVPVRPVHARISKAARAAPIAVQYERGAVKHIGLLHELEDQMCTWRLGERNSPDRIDALVWALDHLISSTHSNPRMRQI